MYKAKLCTVQSPSLPLTCLNAVCLVELVRLNDIILTVTLTKHLAQRTCSINLTSLPLWLRCCPSDHSIFHRDVTSNSWGIPGKLHFIARVPESESCPPPHTHIYTLPFLSFHLCGNLDTRRLATQTPEHLSWLTQNSPISRTEYP